MLILKYALNLFVSLWLNYLNKGVAELYVSKINFNGRKLLMSEELQTNIIKW